MPSRILVTRSLTSFSEDGDPHARRPYPAFTKNFVKVVSLGTGIEEDSGQDRRNRLTWYALRIRIL